MVSTPLKNISQNGNLPQDGVKIKNIWNHHLEKKRLEDIYISFQAHNRDAVGWWIESPPEIFFSSEGCVGSQTRQNAGNRRDVFFSLPQNASINLHKTKNKKKIENPRNTMKYLFKTIQKIWSSFRSGASWEKFWKKHPQNSASKIPTETSQKSTPEDPSNRGAGPHGRRSHASINGASLHQAIIAAI